MKKKLWSAFEIWTGIPDNDKEGKALKREWINVSELKRLVEWGEQERMNNNIFGKSNCDLNDDWIEKIEELYLFKSRKKKRQEKKNSDCPRKKNSDG